MSVARSSAGTKPKKPRNSDSHIYATCEPEDAASQTSNKSACSSSGTKPKDTPDQASTTKAIQLNFTSRPRKHDAQTKRAPRGMSNSGGKQSFISTPGACIPLFEHDRQNDDDNDDSVPEQPPKKRHAQTRRSTRNTLNSGERLSLENTSGKCDQPSKFDDGNKDDDDNLDQR